MSLKCSCVWSVDDSMGFSPSVSRCVDCASLYGYCQEPCVSMVRGGNVVQRCEGRPHSCRGEEWMPCITNATMNFTVFTNITKITLYTYLTEVIEKGG